jgi:galactose oxidase
MPIPARGLARSRHRAEAAVSHPDCRPSSGDYSPNAEIYSPPYLFKGQRPAVTSAPANVRYGQTFLIGTADLANITKVTWIRLSSVTHAFNQNQRINFLSFAAAANGLNVRARSDPNLCPRGHYMLFLLNGKGLPSIGKIVRIGST